MANKVERKSKKVVGKELGWSHEAVERDLPKNWESKYSHFNQQNNFLAVSSLKEL